MCLLFVDFLMSFTNRWGSLFLKSNSLQISQFHVVVLQRTAKILLQVTAPLLFD